MANSHHCTAKAEDDRIWSAISLLDTQVSTLLLSLAEKEFYSQAVKQFPELALPSDIDHRAYSVTTSVFLERDSYCDNATILGRFERLFKLITFKTECKNAEIQLIGDNARAHSAKSYLITDFARSIGKQCPVEKIDSVFDSQGSKQTLNGYFREGPNKGMSKYLVETAGELTVRAASTPLLEK